MMTKPEFLEFVHRIAAILNRSITYLDESETWVKVGDDEIELTRGNVVLQRRRYIVHNLDPARVAEGILLSEADRRPAPPWKP